jgi:hypothetical protein
VADEQDVPSAEHRDVWRRWVLMGTAAIFTGDALFGDSRPTWERVVKGLLAGGLVIGELTDLGRRRNRG